MREIELGAVKQECFDAATRFLESRLHSVAELRRKLVRQEWGKGRVEGFVLNAKSGEPVAGATVRTWARQPGGNIVRGPGSGRRQESAASPSATTAPPG